MTALGTEVRPNYDALRRSFEVAGVIGIVSLLLLVVLVIGYDDFSTDDFAYSIGSLTARLSMAALATWGVARGAPSRWRTRRYGLVVFAFTLAITAVTGGA